MKSTMVEYDKICKKSSGFISNFASHLLVPNDFSSPYLILFINYEKLHDLIK